jgi:hypothetical protein
VPAARTSEKTHVSDIPSGPMLTFTASEFACKKFWTSFANHYEHRNTIQIGLHSTKGAAFSQLFSPNQNDRIMLGSVFLIVCMCAAFCVLVHLFVYVYSFPFLSWFI